MHRSARSENAESAVRAVILQERGTLARKKAKIGRPKLPKGEARGRIVPVRFADDEIKAMVRASRAASQTISEWLRDLARRGTTMQPLVFIECPECRALASKTLVLPICDSCKAKQTEGHSS